MSFIYMMVCLLNFIKKNLFITVDVSSAAEAEFWICIILVDKKAGM